MGRTFFRSTEPQVYAVINRPYLSLYTVLGLPLLYTSAYFLPYLTPTGAYLLPSINLWRLIIAPSLLSVALGALLVVVVCSAARRWLAPNVSQTLAILAISTLALIGLKCVMAAMAFDWEDHVPRGSELLSTLRYTKLTCGCVLLVCVWFTRGALLRWSRLLGSLGFAFGILGLIRIIVVMHPGHSIPTARGEIALSLSRNVPDIGEAQLSEDLSRPRRVIWVIFDEADFERIYQQAVSLQVHLPNFNRLAAVAVFATNANSPASATLYSIPSLLTGTPISGDGIKIETSGSLMLQKTTGAYLPFDEGTSIFGMLQARGLTSSVLGFYHPYCRLFVLTKCDGFDDSGVGAIDGALRANIPDSLSKRFGWGGHWEMITRDSMELIESFVERDDALTFMHLNFPHLPADYADKILRLPGNSDPQVEYTRNLLLADRVLGEIITAAQSELQRHQVLLVVSGDHWLRNRWYRANEPEHSKPVPFIVWKVGESKGAVVSNPFSTVHTAAMILNYLDGGLRDQKEIVRWLESQDVFPTFIAPNT